VKKQPILREVALGTAEDDWYVSSSKRFLPSPTNNILRSRPWPAFRPISQDPSARSCVILVIISLQVGALLFSSSKDVADGSAEEINTVRPQFGSYHDGYRKSLHRGKLSSSPSSIYILHAI
jgi:hypothetical protein